MNKEAQRIAIAEACNWMHPEYGLLSNGWRDSDGCWHFGSNALNDLNACHEAEKVLTGRRECPPTGQWSNYWQELISVCYPTLATHATAPQRAEAFLRTIGKWNDGP